MDNIVLQITKLQSYLSEYKALSNTKRKDDKANAIGQQITLIEKLSSNEIMPLKLYQKFNCLKNEFALSLKKPDSLIREFQEQKVQRPEFLSQEIFYDNEIQQNNQLIEERQRESEAIHHDVGLVSEIFRGLHNLVTYQGTLIDNIEQNLESVEISTENASNSLVYSSKKLKNKKTCCCWILFILFLVLVFLVVCIKLT